jgi:tyrosyl-tRNA synthetase
VGDPSGKDESRQLLTTEVIQKNADSIAQVFKKFITFGDGPTDAIMVNNADWLDNINYLEFLRDYGRYFTINRMLSFESVKQRLAREQPLTFLEFNYMLLQAYDFLELSRRYDACLQLGGSDQWGNIISGVELARKVDQRQLFGLTAPLITTSDGKKMGKTASGAMWLNKDLLSEFEYWQFWRNTGDADVIRFLKLFTEVPIDKLREMGTWEGAELNAAKVILADEATRLLHGGECLEQIHATAQSLFAGGKGGKVDLDSLPRVEIEGAFPIPVVDLLVKAAFAASKGEAKRLIKGGGARVNDEKVTDEGAVVGAGDFVEGVMKLSSGKKNHCLVVLASASVGK